MGKRGLVSVSVSIIALPSDIDTVDTLDGFRRTLGVRWAHPGDAGLVGGNPAEAICTHTIRKSNLQTKVRRKRSG